MKVIIKETSEVKTLSLCDHRSGTNYICDFIGNTGAMNDGQFSYDDELDAFVCDQDTFAWWDRVVTDQQNLEDMIGELIDEHGQEAVYNALQDAGSDDLEVSAELAMAALRDTFDQADCASCDTPTFNISSEEEFNADHYGCGRYLTTLGGCSDSGEEYGLGDWTYQFEVEVTNQNGETEKFTVAYQPEERNNGLKNYSGYDVARASLYGYDADESSELEEFCDYDTSVLDALHDKAWDAAKAEFERLLGLLEDGDIQVRNDEY